MNITESQLNNAIDAAILDGDLPTLASLMQQKQHLPLMLVGRLVRDVKQESDCLNTLITDVQRVEGEAYQANGERRNMLTATGAIFDKDPAYMSGLEKYNTVRRWRENLVALQKQLSELRDKSERELAKALKGEPFTVPQANALSSFAGSRARVLSELAAFGIGQEREKIAA